MGLDPRLTNATVVDFPKIDERQQPRANSFILNIAQAAQSITPWGMNYQARDRELRELWKSEPWLASVIYLVSIRNASFEWEVVGSDPTKNPPVRTIQAVTNLLKSSNMGKGWENLITKTCLDLYSQDNGSFWQIIRQDNRNSRSPLRMIMQLDAARCLRTGDPRIPVVYRDRFGKEHLLRYWQVRTLEELPSPNENVFNLQICAVSRALLAAEIIQSIEVYKKEKVDGNFSRAIEIISGVTRRDIEDATAMAKENTLNMGLQRFSVPIMVPSLDPTASLSNVHIDLASLPDNFDEDTSLKWYIAQLAASVGVDYQEIAPLMTGNLGSSQQSEIMHLKTRGKGPALIMRLIENIINELIPRNVHFRFKEQDVRAETEKAEARFARGKDRTMRVKSGELDVKAARRLAVEDGDLQEWMADELDRRGEEALEEAQNEDDQIQSDQIEGGVESGETKSLTMEHVQALRDYISERRKIDYGQPSAAVVLKVVPSESLLKLQRELAARFVGNSTRIIPNGQLHITLLYSPLVENDKLKLAADMLETVMIPKFLIASTLSKFDTENGSAVILKIDDNEQLKELQAKYVETFTQLNIPLSEYSKKWVAHLTLLYTDGEFKDEKISPMILKTKFIDFSRTDYDTIRRIDHALDV